METETVPKVKPISALDGKRSQSVGIAMSSLRMTLDELRKAVLQVDTKALNVDNMRSLWNIRPEPDEVASIKALMASQPKSPLVKQDTFLLALSDIPGFQERLMCMMLRATFDEGVADVATSRDGHADDSRAAPQGQVGPPTHGSHFGAGQFHECWQHPTRQR